jgi:hypothetical protein
MTVWTCVAPRRAENATNALRLLTKTAGAHYDPPEAEATEMLEEIAACYDALIAAYATRGIRPTLGKDTPTAPAEGGTGPAQPPACPAANRNGEPVVGDPAFAEALEIIKGMTYGRVPALAAAIAPPLVPMLAQNLLGRMSDAYAAVRAS